MLIVFEVQETEVGMHAGESIREHLNCVNYTTHCNLDIFNTVTVSEISGPKPQTDANVLTCQWLCNNDLTCMQRVCGI